MLPSDLRPLYLGSWSHKAPVQLPLSWSHPCVTIQTPALTGTDIIKRDLPSCCLEINDSVNCSSWYRAFLFLLVNCICNHHYVAGKKMLLSTYIASSFSGTPSWLLSTGNQTLLESISSPNFLHTSKIPSSRIMLVSRIITQCAREFVYLELQYFYLSPIIFLWTLSIWHQVLPTWDGRFSGLNSHVHSWIDYIYTCKLNRLQSVQ